MLVIWRFPKSIAAAQKAIAGHMRPAGRVFETPVLHAITELRKASHYISVNSDYFKVFEL